MPAGIHEFDGGLFAVVPFCIKTEKLDGLERTYVPELSLNSMVVLKSCLQTMLSIVVLVERVTVVEFNSAYLSV